MTYFFKIPFYKKINLMAINLFNLIITLYTLSRKSKFFN